MSKSFPKGFYWGTATAAFQIEGATNKDGRGESIWDRFAATPGKILTGETGDPACEAYYRIDEDVALMKEIGMNAYRFSIAWPRIIPDGDGAINEAGLDYYGRLVDALLAAGIEPFVTLYHWDLPQALQDKGGWANRATIDAFIRYTDIVVGRLGDRVKNWMTHNEPWCISILSNKIGEHAPGLRDTKIALAVAHNLLVSHGRAVPLIREKCNNAKVGIVLNFNPYEPATDSPQDAELVKMEHERFNLWFLDPLTGRGYPKAAWAAYGDAVPELIDGDMEAIRAPLDFLGVNFYSRGILHDSSKPFHGSGYKIINRRNPRNLMARGWEIHPESLAELLLWLHEDYKLPELVITENGACYDDVLWEGQVHDTARIEYIERHLEVLPAVIEKGVPLTGYFCWSFMDNFEWTFGTHDRFGLVHLDISTQKRTIKDSGRWFARVAKTNSLPYNSDMPEETENNSQKNHMLGSNLVCQVAIVVRDVDRATGKFAGLLGIEPPPVQTANEDGSDIVTYRGEATKGRVRLSFFDMENLVLEFIEPTEDPTTWKEFLDTCGQGVHHIAFKAKGKMLQTAAKLEEFGFPLIQNGKHYAYVDSLNDLGVILELLDID